MKSLQRNFKRKQEANPGWSSYVVFANTVDGQKFSRRIINHWFNKLVENGDYVKTEKSGLIDFLFALSNGK